MAVPVGRKVLLDTNVFIDYLRLGAHAQWVTGPAQRTVRFLSSVVLMELRLGADTLPRRRAVDRIKGAFPAQRLIGPAPDLFDRAAVLFRALHGDGRGLRDRLGIVNDLTDRAERVEDRRHGRHRERRRVCQDPASPSGFVGRAAVALTVHGIRTTPHSTSRRGAFQP